eukprot:8315683-Pyramimonas_sp.AAC.1
MAGGGKMRSEWNQCLLEEAAATAYAKLLAGAAARLGPTKAFWRLWPKTVPSEPWGGMVRALYVALAELPVLPLPLPSPNKLADADPSKPPPRQLWAAPSKAVFPVEEAQNDATLAAALRGQALNLVEGVPREVCALFASVSLANGAESESSFRALTPEVLRAHLRRTRRPPAHRPHALRLLEYCLSDLTDCTHTGPDPWDAAARLAGLPLLPLADRTFGVFARRGPNQAGGGGQLA